MAYFDLDEFIKLSAVLHYQISAAEIDWDSVAGTILGGRRLDRRDRETFQQALAYLFRIYKNRRRRVGTPAVLHPLRSTAIQARVTPDPGLLELLTGLFHDKEEDFGPENFSSLEWLELEGERQRLVGRMDGEARKKLKLWVNWMTRRGEEAYYEYVGRLVEAALAVPEVLRAKLADRLDNTLDLRMDMADSLEAADCFEAIYHLLSTRVERVYQPDVSHPVRSMFKGSERIYQLYKDVVLMTIMRQRGADVEDEVVHHLFEHMAEAGMREAQRIVLHIIGYHLPAGMPLRELVMEALDYIYAGGIDQVTSPEGKHRLDGFFLSCFEGRESDERKRKRERLYEDKVLMLQGGMAFIAMFLQFRDDPGFYVHGVSDKGVAPE